MNSFLTAATKPLDTQNTIMTLCPHYLDKRNTQFLITLILVFLASKGEKLLFQKCGNLVLY